MKKSVTLSILLFFLLNNVIGCSPNVSPTPTSTANNPTPTLPEPTPTFQSRTLIVTSIDDDGRGTLRQALTDTQSGDKITFDATVFPPKKPVVIKVLSPLPAISQGNITIDASNAGVILDGSQASGDWTPGIEIDSEHNIIQGLQVVHFSGPGILLNPPAQFNLVGGDRKVGIGPLGQGNLFGDTSDGIAITGSDNVITGNLIGTDVSGSGKMGNRAVGVYLDENASRNTIGPNNIIAYNGTRGYGGGIEIRSLYANANNITTNSIHDNTAPGIFYNINGNAQGATPTKPTIIDFDLAAGTVEGVTCPDCTVEISSTSTADGEIYEGMVTADQYGNFSLSKGQGFAGPSLTATSRSSNGNTSEFSAPTSGTRRVLILQKQNDEPRSLLVTKPSSELGDNRIGQIFDKLYLLGDPQGVLNTEITVLGTKYVKLTITEAEALTTSVTTAEPVRWDIPEFSFDPAEEDFITKLAENGITVDYMLTFWDKANHPQGWQPNISRFKTQEEIDHYLEYVRFIVSHFKGRVKSYEIWNEPDNKIPLQWIQPNDYINLVRQTVPVIRAEDPNAKIVIGGTTGLGYPDSQAYLFNILNSDIMPSVDVVSWHPFYGDSPEHNSEYYYAYPSLVEQIKATAASHGFNGEFRVDEVTYRSPDCTWCDPGDVLYSNVIAAKYYARGIIVNLGMDVGVGVGGESSLRRESFTVVQNLCTLMAGAKPKSLPLEIQSQATNIKGYGFSLPDGDQLLALWTDGVAVDDDLGISSTLTIPGFADWNATGIDVLNGFEQKLITGNDNGNLIIQGLLIKDYPLVIRLSK
jgi:hypothetical protein